MTAQPSPSLCPCGSGLSRARCCALDLTGLGAPAAARHLAALEAQAETALRSGDADTAARLALDAIELAPQLVGMLVLLFKIRRQQGNSAAAEALVRRIVALDPNHFWATNEITLMMLAKGDVAEAELHARNAVRIAPENAQAHYLMGLVMTEAFRPAVGEYHFLQAEKLSGGRDPVLLSNHALCLKNQGKIAAARALYAEALAASPEHRRPAAFHRQLQHQRFSHCQRRQPRHGDHVSVTCGLPLRSQGGEAARRYRFAASGAADDAWLIRPTGWPLLYLRPTWKLARCGGV